jgi:hypothetical protein
MRACRKRQAAGIALFYVAADETTFELAFPITGDRISWRPLGVKSRKWGVLLVLRRLLTQINLIP